MLDNGDGKEVLRTRLFEKYQHLVEDEVMTDEFLNMLTCLALAIVQAAAFINQNDIQLSDYIQLYRASKQQATQLLSEHFQDQGRYREMKNPIATTWYVSFDQITSRDKLAADYLSFMACIANNDIPDSILPGEGPQLEQTKAIGTLKAYAFVTERMFAGDKYEFQQAQTQRPKISFNVHPLVHLVMRGWLKSQSQWLKWVEKEIVPFGDHRTREMWTPYLPHAKYVMGVPEIFEQDAGLDLLERIGQCKMMLGRYRVAEEIHRQLLCRTVNVFSEEHPYITGYKNCLGVALFKQNRYGEAEAIFREVTVLREKTFGQDDGWTRNVKNNLATVLRLQDYFEVAEKIYRLMITLSEKDF